MALASSLFDVPSSPPIEAGTAWLSQLVSGGLATSLCIVAVAILGILMMLGRVSFRDAIRVVLGCFVLLSAPLLALELLAVANGVQAGPSSESAVTEPVPPSSDRLPPANYDPYAGASLRSD